MKQMKTKGISLIVLIITIVVIIILATAIIVNLAQTNIIANANEAVVKQDFKAMQDELNLYVADKYADTLGALDVATVDASTEDEVKAILKSSSKSKYIEYVTIVDGKIVISETAPSDIKEWASEAINSTGNTSNNPSTPTQPEQTDTPVFQPGNEVATQNSSITGGDFLSTNPVIPVGFKTSTSGASWNDSDTDGIVDGWNDGLVIVDAIGNEFVWVPCTTNGANGTIQYTKNFTYPNNYSASSSNTSDDADALPIGIDGTIIDENAQISKYGGFYIGRYEAGVPGKTGTPSNSTGVPTVQQGATVWTNIDYNNANTNAKSFVNTDYVKSGLVTGTQWDTAMKWIENAGISVTDSRSWGNYYDDPVDGNNGKHTAGFKEEWKAKNIYDLAGNTWEWTGEIYFTNRFSRGGDYDGNGSNRPASYRFSDDPSYTNDDISFRLVLYVM